MGFVIVSGLAIGMVFAAVALVYNVMYSTSKVLSVTTGHIAMLGGVFGAWFVSALHWPWYLGLLGAMAVGAAFGWLTDLLAIRRVLARSDEHLWLLSTLAIATMLQQVVALWWGTEPKPFPRLIPQDFSAGLLDQKFWLPVALAVVMAIGLDLFYRRTMYGKLFVAMSEDAFAARARGVSTDRIRELSYLLAGALGGLTELLAIRRVLNRSDEHLWLLSTLALATMVQQGVGLWWGTEPKPFQIGRASCRERVCT